MENSVQHSGVSVEPGERVALVEVRVHGSELKIESDIGRGFKASFV